MEKFIIIILCIISFKCYSQDTIVMNNKSYVVKIEKVDEDFIYYYRSGSKNLSKIPSASVDKYVLSDNHSKIKIYKSLALRLS